METQTTDRRRLSAEAANRRPIILMTPDLQEAENSATERTYTVRANYAEAIADAGGIPLILPYEPAMISDAIAFADGILITGAQPGAEVAPRRREFEKALVGQALDAGKPLLGVCHGMQLIGELLGGTFVTSLSETSDGGSVHLPQEIPNRTAHDIIIQSGNSVFQKRAGAIARVNSLHRHALAGSGQFRVTARAPDGVIEAFEGLTPGFCLCVQWHPEYRLTSLDRHVLKTFVEHAAGNVAISTRSD